MSHSLSLHVTFSLSICLLFPSLWMANWPAAPISSPCLTPPSQLSQGPCVLYVLTCRKDSQVYCCSGDFRSYFLMKSNNKAARSKYALSSPCAFVLRDINTDSQTATCTHACMRQAQVGSFIREYKTNFSPCSPRFTLSVTPSLPLYALFFSSFSAF